MAQRYLSSLSFSISGMIKIRKSRHLPAGIQTNCGGLFHFSKEPVKIGDCLNALIKIKEFKLFVGRMQVVTVQTKSHKDNLDSQFLFKQGADGYASSSAHGDGLLAKSGFDSFFCCPVCLRIDGGHIWLATMVFLRLDRY